MNPFKIFLIDDSEIHLAGLKFLLSENNNITIIGCAKSSKSALKSKELAQTDVVILDISLETESDGLDLVKPILSINPKIKIIILSQHKNIHFIVKSLQKGVSAYIAKDTSIEQLNIVIELIMKGDGFFLGETIPKNTLMDWFSETNPANNPQKPWNLSEREIEIIDLLAKGHIAKEISEMLNIAIPTIESHKENIKHKLNCKTIVGVVAFALKNGLIS